MKNEISLKRPTGATKDSGKLCTGDYLIAPQIKRPSPQTADNGRLRIGDCLISVRS